MNDSTFWYLIGLFGWIILAVLIMVFMRGANLDRRNDDE